MKLKPGFEEEYKKRHDEIWPEMEELLKASGVSDYSIFFDEQTLILFAVQKLEENQRTKNLAEHEIMQKWWKHMADLMETNDDDSPTTESLREVFHLD